MEFSRIFFLIVEICEDNWANFILGEDCAQIHFHFSELIWLNFLVSLCWGDHACLSKFNSCLCYVILKSTALNFRLNPKFPNLINSKEKILHSGFSEKNFLLFYLTNPDRGKFLFFHYLICLVLSLDISPFDIIMQVELSKLSLCFFVLTNHVLFLLKK